MSEVIAVRKGSLERLQTSGLGFQVLNGMPSDGTVVSLPYLAFERCRIAAKRKVNKESHATTVAFTVQIVTASDQPGSFKDLDGLVDEVDEAMEVDLDLSTDGLSVLEQESQEIEVSFIDDRELGELEIARLTWNIEVY